MKHFASLTYIEIMDTLSPYSLQILRDTIYHNPAVAEELGLHEDMEFLGEGAFGHVYALNDRLAVKITRHSDEAQIAKKLMKLRLPNVVRIHRVMTLGEYRHLIVMERLKKAPLWTHELFDRDLGPDHVDKRPKSPIRLRNLRRRDKSLTKRERRFLRQIDTAYWRLYAHGIRHTDVHRYNVMMNDDGEFKLIDVM